MIILYCSLSLSKIVISQIMHVLVYDFQTLLSTQKCINKQRQTTKSLSSYNHKLLLLTKQLLFMLKIIGSFFKVTFRYGCCEMIELLFQSNLKAQIFFFWKYRSTLNPKCKIYLLVLHKLKRFLHFSLNYLFRLGMDINFVSLFPQEAKHKFSTTNKSSIQKVMIAI